MKAIALVSGLLLGTVGVLGQGTLQFRTRDTSGVDAPVHFGVPGDSTGRADSDYRGQLYAGPEGGSVVPVGTPVPFRGDLAVGYISDGVVTVPGIAGGSRATVELRAWHAGAGDTYEQALAANGGWWCGKSSPIQLILGGGGVPPNPAALLISLQGFVIPVPEPSPAVLGLLASSALTVGLLWRQPPPTRPAAIADDSRNGGARSPA